MGNENIYRDGNRLYAKSVKRSLCVGKTGDVYKLRCRIIQRGVNDYLYRIGEDHLEHDNRKLWLTDDAIRAVAKSVELFEKELSEINVEENKITVIDGAFWIYYRVNSQNNFDCLLKVVKDGREHLTLSVDIDMEELFKGISFAGFSSKYKEHEAFKIIKDSSSETIDKNPIYAHALRSGDEGTAKRIKLYYNLATEEDCKSIEKLLGVRILPKLTNEFDKIYVADSKTIDFKLLHNSGYTIWHKPYFAMRGYTHDKCEINPHAKYVVDAAKENKEPMSFSEFLEMIDNSPKE